MLLFGSELKSLLAHGGLARDIDPLRRRGVFRARLRARAAHDLRGGAQAAAGAHAAAAPRRSRVPEPREYWDVALHASATRARRRRGVRGARRRGCDESVRLRMISEVPLGAFLSGGVDSSAVVAMMARRLGRARSTPARSRSPIRRSTNRSTRSRSRSATARDHHVERVESDDFDLIDTLARLYDEPYADSSAIPTYRVCQLARKHVTVALSGDGGDESFGGYRRYRLHLMEERMRAPLPLALRRPLFGLLGRVYPKADWAPRVLRAKTTFEALGARFGRGLLPQRVDPARRHARAALQHARSRRSSAATTRSRCSGVMPRRRSTDDPLALIQYLDLKTYLVGDINTKVDRASMAHSLEVREPLMDHPLVEWLATLPSSLKVRGGEGKWLLKKAMEPHLPRDVLYRPKMGFAVPLARWFRGPLRAARARRAARRAARRDRPVRAGVPASTWSTHHRVGRARLQRAAVDAADVRRVPAQRRRRSGAVRRARPRWPASSTPCASCTSSTTRCRCTAATRSARWRSCASSARSAGRRCSSRRRGTAGGAAEVEDVDGWRFHRTPLRDRRGRRVPGVGYVARDARRRARRLDELVETLRPDILHAHSPVLNALPALRVGRRLGIPVVYEVRAFWEDAAVDHGTTRGGQPALPRCRARSRPTRCAAPTTSRRSAKACGDEIVGARHRRPTRVTVIPNAVDVAQFRVRRRARPRAAARARASTARRCSASSARSTPTRASTC